MMRSFSGTHLLLGSLLGCFFLFWLLLATGIVPLDAIALQGEAFVGGTYWTLLTSIFYHAGFFHLFANLFTLYFIGSFCEHFIGRKRFLLLFLCAGIGGGLAYVGGVFLGTTVSWGASVFGTPATYAVGASGGLFGLLGVLAVLIPRHRIFLIVGPLLVLLLQTVVDSFVSGAFGMFLSLFLTVCMFLQLLALFSFRKRWQRFALPLALPLWLAPLMAILPLVLLSFIFPLPIGNSAHFGGLVVGILYGWLLRRAYPRKVRALGNVFR
jgi:membrane associated rhomboid family serine protease